MYANRISVALLACAGVLCTASYSAAQVTREQTNLARQFALGKAPESNEAKQALALMIKAELDRIATASKPEDLAKLDDIRTAIFNTYLLGSRSEQQPARKAAVTAITHYGQRMLADAQVAPHAKISILALIAELDDAPPMNNEPPQPARSAFSILYPIAQSEAQPIYLRAVALHGLQRQLGVWWFVPQHWTDAQKQHIAGTLTKVVTSEPASPLEAKAHAWLVRRAFDCLAVIAVPSAADRALEYLADASAPAGLRLSAAEYLSRIDNSQLPEDKKQLYLVGIGHLIRSQLVDWYEKEDDFSKAKSGAMAGGYGGYGGYGGEMGGYGGGGYGSDMSGYGEGGGYGGGYGGEGDGGYGGTPAKPKPIDTQTWQTRAARRLVNHVAQNVRTSLAGAPTAEARSVVVVKPLSNAGLPASAQTKVDELTTAVDAFLVAVNDPSLVTDVNSLLKQAMLPIEDIMDLVMTIPGFPERYPELVGDEELKEVIAVPPPAAPPEGGEGQEPEDDGTEGDSAAGPQGQPRQPPNGNNGAGNNGAGN